MKKRIRQFGFTIAELMVAVAIMAVVLTGAGYIFKVAIDAQRTANATAEIMRNLRGITDQIDSDFKGLCKNVPLAIWFDKDARDPSIRVDQIMFFADGDFHTYTEWGTPSEIIRGNVARIYYGQARCRDTNDKDILRNPNTRVGGVDDGISRTSRGRWNIWLVRNQHILTINDKLTGDADWPDWQGWSQFEKTLKALPTPPQKVRTELHNPASVLEDISKNALLECDKGSLAQWLNIPFNSFKSAVIPVCLDNRIIAVPEDANTFQNLWCQNVSSFAVQWGYYDDSTGVNQWRWWPSDDPDGDGDNSDSHFTSMGKDDFGVYFNVDKSNAIDFLDNGVDWHIPANAKYTKGGTSSNFAGFYPSVLKFTIKLDSKTLIKGKPLERTFTHIVYLNK